jgi:hypothetical protein
MGGGKTEIGGGRPGMTNIVRTTDGKWLLTYEYWGGGANTRYRIADDPLKFYTGSATGTGVTSLPVAAGSRALATGGSPVVIRLPGGRLVYNAAGSGNVWVNESGRSDGVWKEYQTTSRAGYSRNLQYVEGTGRIAILNNQGTSTLAYAEVDLGHSDGAYYQLVNRRTDQVIGTGNKTNDANIGNGDVPDLVLEEPGSAANPVLARDDRAERRGEPAEQVGRPRGGHLDGERDGRPEDRPVGRQQRHRQLEPRQDRRRVLQTPVVQEQEPVLDRRVRRGAAHLAERDRGRLAGLGARRVDR